jgi:hypothetical protein
MNLSEELEKMRDAFLKRCKDFIDFQKDHGYYFDHERSYKEALILKAKTILDDPGGNKPEKVGLQFLDLVKQGGFVGWQAFDAIARGGADAQHEVAVALGELLFSKVPPAVAAAASAERIHPILKIGRGGDNSFGLVRTLVTSVLALAMPSKAIAIKTRYMQRAAKQLTGTGLFKAVVMSADEYQAFLDLAFQIQKELIRWDWKPRDLWDVQGFLWVVTNYEDEPTLPPPTGEPEVKEPVTPRHPLNLILHGPPGTGKTWSTGRLAVQICQDRILSDLVDDRQEVMRAYRELVGAGRVVFTTFHQSIGYEEFVEGLRPVTDRVGQPSAGFRLEPCKGVFRDICERASASRLVPFVLVIDEINRANVSKVFGELITLLEPDKRQGELNALTVTLPYSKEAFGVPNNLYVVGTMNTADRSIALLDTALRRRFEFEEMMPNYTCLDRAVDGIHLGNLLKAINRRVEWLFDRDHQIGHSYFINVATLDGLDEVMRARVIPLLTEYFYEDWEKVRAALNDREECFIIKEELPAPPLLENEDRRWRYSINKEDFPIDGYEAASELT